MGFLNDKDYACNIYKEVVLFPMKIVFDEEELDLVRAILEMGYRFEIVVREQDDEYNEYNDYGEVEPTEEIEDAKEIQA